MKQLSVVFSAFFFVFFFGLFPSYQQENLGRAYAQGEGATLETPEGKKCGLLIIKLLSVVPTQEGAQLQMSLENIHLEMLPPIDLSRGVTAIRIDEVTGVMSRTPLVQDPKDRESYGGLAPDRSDHGRDFLELTLVGGTKVVIPFEERFSRLVLSEDLAEDLADSSSEERAFIVREMGRYRGGESDTSAPLVASVDAKDRMVPAGEGEADIQVSQDAVRAVQTGLERVDTSKLTEIRMQGFPTYRLPDGRIVVEHSDGSQRFFDSTGQVILGDAPPPPAASLEVERAGEKKRRALATGEEKGQKGGKGGQPTAAKAPDAPSPATKGGETSSVLDQISEAPGDVRRGTSPVSPADLTPVEKEELAGIANTPGITTDEVKKRTETFYERIARRRAEREAEQEYQAVVRQGQDRRSTEDMEAILEERRAAAEAEEEERRRAAAATSQQQGGTGAVPTPPSAPSEPQEEFKPITQDSTDKTDDEKTAWEEAGNARRDLEIAKENAQRKLDRDLAIIDENEGKELDTAGGADTQRGRSIRGRYDRLRERARAAAEERLGRRGEVGRAQRVFDAAVRDPDYRGAAEKDELSRKIHEAGGLDAYNAQQRAAFEEEQKRRAAVAAREGGSRRRTAEPSPYTAGDRPRVGPGYRDPRLSGVPLSEAERARVAAEEERAADLGLGEGEEELPSGRKAKRPTRIQFMASRLTKKPPSEADSTFVVAKGGTAGELGVGMGAAAETRIGCAYPLAFIEEKDRMRAALAAMEKERQRRRSTLEECAAGLLDPRCKEGQQGVIGQ